MTLSRATPWHLIRARGLVQLLALCAVLLLPGPAFAAIFAPVCDPSGATLPVAAPATEGDNGAIDTWACGDDPFSAREVGFNAAPSRGGESELGLSPASIPAAPAWRAVLAPSPVQKRVIWADGCGGSLPNGYATGPFRPPRLTNCA
jgi:hypothetical protein